jgi:hypothetical protein
MNILILCKKYHNNVIKEIKINNEYWIFCTPERIDVVRGLYLNKLIYSNGLIQEDLTPEEWSILEPAITSSTEIIHFLR